MSRILIVEDEAIIRSALKRLLERHDHRVSEAGSVAEALALEPQGFDLVISDLRLPGEPGTELIARAAPVPVLIMTSYASMRSAVEALKQGAVDYVAKPFDHDELLETVARVLHQQATQQGEPPDITEPDGQRQTMIGNCPAMQVVYTRIRKAAPADVTVLVQGESGTGKELVARALHQQSRREKAHAYLRQLCGHSRDADRVRAVRPREGRLHRRQRRADRASRGRRRRHPVPRRDRRTAPDAQARLLRVLQEGEIRKIGSVETRHVNVRLIAATHRDLQAMSKTGEFRLDLYYRLNVMQIDLPRCASARTTSCRSPMSCWRRPVAATTGKAYGSHGPPAEPSATTPGPATCASWRTPWSAASSSPRAT